MKADVGALVEPTIQLVLEVELVGERPPRLEARLHEPLQPLAHALRLAIPGVEDPLVGTQLAYEQSLQADLEIKLRTAQPPPPELLTQAVSVLDRLVAEASGATPSVKTSVVSFLDTQARAVADEVAAPDPDPGVIAGAVAAADALCRSSLGSVISPTTTADIASVASRFSAGELR